MKTFQISRHYLAVVALLSGANSFVTASGFDFGAGSYIFIRLERNFPKGFQMNLTLF